MGDQCVYEGPDKGEVCGIGETGNGRRETGDGKGETEDGKGETGNGRRETGNGRRETYPPLAGVARSAGGGQQATVKRET